VSSDDALSVRVDYRTLKDCIHEFVVGIEHDDFSRAGYVFMVEDVFHVHGFAFRMQDTRPLRPVLVIPIGWYQVDVGPYACAKGMQVSVFARGRVARRNVAAGLSSWER